MYANVIFLLLYKKTILYVSLGNEPPDFPVDVDYLKGIKTRLSLARSIDKEEHRYTPSNLLTLNAKLLKI